MAQLECDYAQLHRAIKTAYQTRFFSVRHLRLRRRWDNRTLILMSLGLIFISLMQSYSIGKNIESTFVALVQAFMAVVILVYSVSADNDSTAVIADRLYSSASELTSLSKRLSPLKETSFDGAMYEKFCLEYDAILRRYESQSVHDSRYDYLRATLSMPNLYPYSAWNRFLISTRVAAHNIYEFSGYAGVLVIFSFMVYWVIWGF